MKKLFVVLLSVRILSVFLVRTYFVADEYWQSLEVAHKSAFGYGYLTWEWREGIRSSFYPMIFAAVYKILSFLNVANPILIITIPRLLQALLSAVGDYYTYLLSHKLHGSHAANWTVFSLITSWFLFYCSSRTIINSTEMAVTAIGLFYYPWTYRHSKLAVSGYLYWASISCVLRPTAAVIWIHLYLWHLARLKNVAAMWHLFKTFLIGAASLGILVLVDRGFYGKWILTPWNFFHWNWTLNISEFYGSHPWHWYIVQGIPAILSGHTVPFVYGFSKCQLWPLYAVVFYFVGFLSLVPHKEFRFLLPVMPVIFIINGKVLNSLSKRYSSGWFSRSLVLFLLLSNVPLAAFFGNWHKKGQLEVMTFIQEKSAVTSDMSVLFLMPCHSTPYYSHVHSNIEMNFLTCEPKPQDRVNKFEADVFFMDPVKGTKLFLKGDSPPTHIVLFDSLLTKIRDLLLDYEECFKAFNNHFEEHKEVFVLCRKIK